MRTQDRAALQASVAQHDVVVTSYEHVRSDIEWLETQRWDYCVLDEGHAIRNPSSKLSQVWAPLSCLCTHCTLLST